MNGVEKADILLEKLKEDSVEYKGLETAGCSLGEKKNAIRSLMNIRMPRELPDGLAALQDDYLQEELKAKGVVTLADIPTIKEAYNSQYPHAGNKSFHAENKSFLAEAEFFHTGNKSFPVENKSFLAEAESFHTGNKPFLTESNSLLAENTPFLAEKLSLWQGDITRLKVGAIVNAANSQMLGCFVPCHRCIDNAIHSAAGMQLREECSHIMHRRRLKYGRNYEEPTGTATLTLSYNLPCEYVIHTVGPIVYGGLNDRLCQDLRSCYENVLKCCLEHHIKSAAFCCISTGEFHFPNDKAAEIAVETVTGFLEKHGDCMDRIIFNVFKDSDLEIYEKILGCFSVC